MPMFERKPPRVEAIQWDGTATCFDALRELLKKSQSRVTGWRLHNYYSVGHADDTLRLELDWEGEYFTMHPDDWIILENGKLRYMPDEAFQSDYAPVEE